MSIVFHSKVSMIHCLQRPEPYINRICHHCHCVRKGNCASTRENIYRFQSLFFASPERTIDLYGNSFNYWEIKIRFWKKKSVLKKKLLLKNEIEVENNFWFRKKKFDFEKNSILKKIQFWKKINFVKRNHVNKKDFKLVSLVTSLHQCLCINATSFELLLL